MSADKDPLDLEPIEPRHRTEFSREAPFDYRQASALMESQNIDVLLACSRANVGYLADYTYQVAQGLPFMLEDGVDWSLTFVGIPRDSKLGAFITPVTGEEGNVALANPWIEDRRFWGPRWNYVGRRSVSDAAATDVAVCVAAALRDRALDGGRIGLELAATPAARYLRLRELLPKAEFVDAAPILWALRAKKTSEEIERLRRVALATDVAIRTGYQALNAGLSEKDLEIVLAQELMAQGVSYGWCSVAFGPKGATVVHPTDRLPSAGEIIRVDLVGQCAGYFSDISRVAAFARQPNAEAQRAHAAILEANRVLREETGPGARCADLARLARGVLKNRGYSMLAPYAGHGIGRDVHEPPFLIDSEDRELEAGMVLDLEPALRVVGVGSVNIEDMVLVTANGCEPLTAFPRELIIFGQGA